MLIEKIKTINSFYENRLKEKGSIFIAQIYPVKSNYYAKMTLETIRKKYFDATHHCYAYSVMYEETKYSDDGEPTGTAGIRILNAINHFELTNILAIVIRYFGGTKLGIGPLGKAYYQSVITALENCNIVEKILYKKVRIEYTYNLISQIHHLLSQYKAKEISNKFVETPAIECFIEKGLYAKFEAELLNKTKNRVKITTSPGRHFIN